MKPYFTRRINEDTSDFEEQYWGTVVDPDGKKRDRLQERQQHLDDINEELNFINRLSAGKILDIGCGLGYMLSGVDDSWSKFGVEVSAFASEHAQQWGDIFTGKLEDAGYDEEYFDVIVLYHVIEHVADPTSMLMEIRRILKPEGYLILGTPDFDCGCARRFGENFRLLQDKTHINLFTNESMCCFLRDHHFDIEHVGRPFFETRHFTEENLLRLFDTNKVSPPFYGNIMTFYCCKLK